MNLVRGSLHHLFFWCVRFCFWESSWIWSEECSPLWSTKPLTVRSRVSCERLLKF
ncbi:hypothetical protein AtEden1_Chr1g0047631 [Arabidopsis thaliana]